jgi:hypothetical protein
MGMADMSGVTARSMRASMSMIQSRGMGYTHGQMDAHTKVSGRMASSMDLRNGALVALIKLDMDAGSKANVLSGSKRMTLNLFQSN